MIYQDLQRNNSDDVGAGPRDWASIGFAPALRMAGEQRMPYSWAMYLEWNGGKVDDLFRLYRFADCLPDPTLRSRARLSGGYGKAV